jgi:tyrosyl-tRNA synthetase
VKYFELVSSKAPPELDEIRKRMNDPSVNPSHLKRELARDLVSQFHDAEAAQAAEAHFNRLFVEHQRPEETACVEVEAGDGGVWIAKVLTQARLCDSSSAARRMIQQGAVKVDGAKVTDVDLRLAVRKQPYAIQVGKRGFVDVVVS